MGKLVFAAISSISLISLSSVVVQASVIEHPKRSVFSVGANRIVNRDDAQELILSPTT